MISSFTIMTRTLFYNKINGITNARRAEHKSKLVVGLPYEALF